MATLTYSRKDIDTLCSKLLHRAVSLSVSDAESAANMVAAARLLRKMLESGVPVSSFEVENGRS